MKKTISYLLALCMLITSLSVTAVAAQPAVNAANTQDDGVIAYAYLGSKVVAEGMTVKLGPYDAEPTVTDVKGVEGWLLDPDKGTNFANIYVDVDDDLCFALTDASNYEVEVEYYEDNNQAFMTLEYQDYIEPNTLLKQQDKEFKSEDLSELEIVETQDSYSWRTHTWFLPRAAMKNSVSGADFKFGLHSTFMETSRDSIIIRSVKVRKLGTKDLFNIDVKSDNYGNIFYTGDDIAFDIGLSAKGIAKNTPVNINVKVYDENKNLWLEKDIEQTLKEENKKQTFKLSLDEIDKYHYYMMELAVTSKDGKLESRTKKEFSYVKSFRGENLNQTLGLNYNSESVIHRDDQINQIKMAGFSGVRAYVGNTQSIYSGFGPNYNIRSDFQMSVGKTDLINSTLAAGLKVIDYMGDSRTSPSNGYFQIDQDGGLLNIPDNNNQNEIDRYCETMLEVLRSQNAGTGESALPTFQIGNEIYSARTVSGNAVHAPNNMREIAAFHKTLYPLLKKHYPKVKIVSNGSFASWEKSGQVAYEEGMFDNIDAWGVHPYTQSGTPIEYSYIEMGKNTDSQIWDFRQRLDSLGYEDVEIYATEWGYSSRKYKCPSDVDGQLAYLPQNYMLQMYEGMVDYSILFTLNCGRLYQSGEHQFGICRSSDGYTYRGEEGQGWVPGAAKPAYVGMANVNYMMYDHEYVSYHVLNDDTRLMRWRKTKENKDMITFFTDKEADRLDIDLGTTDVMVYDVNGNATEVHSDTGRYSFEITPFVKYVVGNFTKYQIIDTADTYLDNYLYSAPMNKDVVVTLHNGTGKNLNLDVTLNSESTCTVNAPQTAAPGDNRIVITTGEYAITGDEDIKVTLTDDNGTVYYNEGFVIKYCSDVVTVSAETFMKDGKWHISMALNNNSDSTLEGLLSVQTDQIGELFEAIPITLTARENRVVDKLIEKEVPKEVAYLTSVISYEIGDGEKAEIDKRIDLTTLIYRDSELTIDADLSDWTDAGWITIADRSLFLGAPNNPYSYFNGSSDISGKVAFRWDDEKLYFAADVLDDVRFATGVQPASLWSVDNIQLGLCYDPDGVLGSTKYEELSFGAIDGEPAMYRHYTSSDRENLAVVEGYELAVKTVGNHTYYELSLPWNEVLSNKLEYTAIEPGNYMQIGVQFNDNDGEGRKGIMIYGWGTGGEKDHNVFTKYYIQK